MLYGNLIFIKKSGGDGSKFPVTERDIKIGRSEDCLIRIYNPQVAPEHCQLIIEDSGQVTLRNLSNHTILNGQQLGLGDVSLRHGDIFKLGERLARWEYLPASKYYTQVLSPTKRLVAVVMPQQRCHDNPETSASNLTVLKKTPVRKRKLSEKVTLETSSAVNIKKSRGSDLTQKSRNHLSKFLTGRQSLKTTKLVLPRAKVKDRKSHSGVVSLKSKKLPDSKSRRSTLPSWKVNIVSPVTMKSTASGVSLKKSALELRKSTKNPRVTSSEDNMESKHKAKSKSSEEMKSTSESISQTPLEKITESSSKMSKKITKSTRSFKSLSPKKTALKTPSKFLMSTPKQKSPRKFKNLIYSESKLASLTREHSFFPECTSEVDLILEKCDSKSWENSNQEQSNADKKYKTSKGKVSKNVLSGKSLPTFVENLNDDDFLVKETKTLCKSSKSSLLGKNSEILKRQSKSSVKKNSISPREVKVKTPRKSIKTLVDYSQKQPKTPAKISGQSDVKIITDVPFINLKDSSNLSEKKPPPESISVKNTPLRNKSALIRSVEKSKSYGRVGRPKSLVRKSTATCSVVDKTSKSISPVKLSSYKKTPKSSPKKSESNLKSRSITGKGVRRKLSPSTSAERAAKKLKTSCPKKPDKNKKAALLVLGIANRNQLLSQNVKVLLKKAIKQSNAASGRKSDRKLLIGARLKKNLRAKSSKAKSRKLSKKNEPIAEVSQTYGLTPKDNKEENQQNAPKVLEISVLSQKEETGEAITSTPSKQNKKLESLTDSLTSQSLIKTTPAKYDKSAENYLFNTNRRCSKRLSSKNDIGRPDFIELSPTALGLIPKNLEVFKTPKNIKRRSSGLVTPKNFRTTGIIKSASTSKIGNRKSVRFSSKDLSFNMELGSPNVAEKTDFDFSPFQTSDITMDVFVSPLVNESSEITKDLNDSKLKSITKEISESFSKIHRAGSSPQASTRKLLQSSERKKTLNEILSNQKVPQSDTTNTLLENPKKKLTAHKNDTPRNGSNNFKGVRQLFSSPDTRESPRNSSSDIKNVSKLSEITKSPKNSLSLVRGGTRMSKPLNQQNSSNSDLTSLREVKKLLETPKAQRSPRNNLLDISELKNLFGTDMQKNVKGLLKTPKQQKSPKNDLSDVRGVKRLMTTPKQQNSPKNDLSDVRGVKRLLKTPKQQKSPKNDLSDVRGVKRLMTTPKQQKSPKNDLSDVRGVKRLMTTPKQQNSPKNDLSDVRGVKRLMTTPKQQKSPRNDLSDVRGVRKLLKTPKQQKSPKNNLSDVRGVKRLLKTPKQQKSPKNDLSDVRGVRRLLKTPKQQKSPKNDLSDVRGVRRLLKTPKQQKSPKNDLSDVRGVRKLLKTPKQQKSPKNNLSDVRGVKRLLTTPKQQKSPKNDLSDVRGVKELLQTPKVEKSPKNYVTDINAFGHLFKSDMQELSTTPTKLTKNLDKAFQTKKGFDKVLGKSEVNELIFEMDESFSNNKKTVSRQSKIKDFRAIRGRRTIRSTPKSPKNDLSDLTGVHELFSRHKPINDLNVDMSGLSELFNLPEIKGNSKQRAVKSCRKIVSSRSKNSSKAEDKVKIMTRGRSKKTPEKETKSESIEKKKIETSDNLETKLKKSKAVKRKAVDKTKASRAKKSPVTNNETESEIELLTSKKAELLKNNQRQITSSRKRKVQFEESEISPAKQRRKPTLSAPKPVSKKAVSKPVKSETTSEDKVSVKSGRKIVTKEIKTEKTSPSVQLRTRLKSAKKIQKVQTKRSPNTSKIILSGSSSEVKTSPRKTRSAQTKAANVASSEKHSKVVNKKIVKSTAGRKKATPVVKRSTSRK